MNGAAAIKNNKEMLKLARLAKKYHLSLILFTFLSYLCIAFVASPVGIAQLVRVSP